MRKIIFCIVLGLLTGCEMLNQHLKHPRVQLDDVKVRAMSLQDTDLDFLFQIQNPNAFGISLRGVSYELELDNKAVLSGKTRSKVRIPAAGRGDMALPLNVQYKKVFRSLETLRRKKSLAYRLRGELDFGLLQIPFSKTGDLDLPRLPSIRVSDIRVTGMSFRDVNMRINMQVKNANRFPMQFRGMQYKLTLANQALLTGRSSESISVGAAGHSKFSLNMKVKLRTLGNLVKLIRRGGSMPLKFSGNLGSSSVNGGSFPLQWNGKVPLRR